MEVAVEALVAVVNVEVGGLRPEMG